MRKRHALVSAVVVSSFLFICSNEVFAFAGGGFKNEAAVDPEALGKGQAVVAQADSPSAVHFNPAGITQLEDNYIRLGSTVQAPRNSHTATNGVEDQMQMQSFIIPSVYMVNDIGLENWKFGLAINSPFGLGTDWADDSFSKFQATESLTEFYQINPNIAYKVNDMLSVAVGIDYMKSYVSKHRRISTALGGGDSHLKGDDDGWGYNVGLLIQPSERHSIGVSYRSKIELTYEGLASLDGLNGVAIGVYSFPGSTYSTDIEAKLVLPRALAAGYAFKPDDKWTIEFDVEWTGWSSIEEDFVRYPNESNPSRLAILNSGNPSAKDWNDSLAYGIGAQYKANDKLTLRGGYLFVETPIPSANFETALPDSDKHNFTFGVGYKINDKLTLDAAYEFVLLTDRDVTNDVAISTSNLDGEYKGYINIVGVTFTYKY